VTGRPFVGLVVALAALALTFRGPRPRFWQRMTATGLMLGSLAVASDARLRRPRIEPRDVALGLGSAFGLYAVFQVADRVARTVLRQGGQEIGEIYALRTLRPKAEIAARLGAVIGPAEELFWRGYVLEPWLERWGPGIGLAAATAAYAGAHLVTKNVTLVGAATVAGLYWGALAVAGMPMAALIVSHVAWDIWIFLIAPTSSPSARGFGVQGSGDSNGEPTEP
jgi:membrane protease YdiL (CAAX protease family)